MAQLAKVIGPLLDTGDFTLQGISEKIDMRVELLDMDQIAWLPGDQEQFDLGQPMLTYDANEQLSIFIKLARRQQLLQLGPITTTSADVEIRRYILLASYLLLGGIIGLWTWPLWRDLRHLQSVAKKFGRGHFDAAVTLGKGSVISPLARTFNDMAEQISRLIDEQRQLTNAVSHDLRTPLSRLKFSIAMLEGNTEKIIPMKQDVNEIEKLIDEILSYGRLENQHEHINLHKVNITQLLENHIDKLQRGSEKQLLLSVEPLLTCVCDGHLIERAIQNLITNALRYGEQEVAITALRRGNKLLIHIDDDGEGICAPDRAKIFKPFIRLDKSRNKSSGGFGLGLAIVQRIMQWHQGECIVAESPMGGARFTLSFAQNLTTSCDTSDE